MSKPAGSPSVDELGSNGAPVGTDGAHRTTGRSVNSQRLRSLLAPFAIATLAVAAVACGDDDSSGGGSGDVTVTAVWVREPAEGADRTAAYGIIANESSEDITLVDVESPVGETVELHETLVDDAGTMSMREREGGFVIESGGTLTLEPGGAHVMIFDVTAADLGDGVDLTFVFDGADDVTASAAVEPIGSGEMDEMDDMDHGGTDMDDMDHGGTDMEDIGS
jgi:copper(I)-binding protein